MKYNGDPNGIEMNMYHFMRCIIISPHCCAPVTVCMQRNTTMCITTYRQLLFHHYYYYYYFHYLWAANNWYVFSMYIYWSLTATVAVPLNDKRTTGMLESIIGLLFY